ETDLYGRGSDSVFLSTKPWGAFEIAISRAHNKSFSHELVAATGYKADPNDHTALILADLDRPLSITGNTKITGDCYLPKAGIQRAYIEGQNYIGDKLVYGETKNADRFLPEYNDTLVKRMEKLFEFQATQNDSVIYTNAFQESDSISNSFFNRPLYIFSEGTIFINSQSISGQVCIISHQSIRVGKNSSIHNALLIAPSIEIENEVSGDFQAFARDSLIVGEKVLLHYPTVLGIIATEKSPDFTSLFIGEKSKIFGELFACTTANDFRKHVVITTSKESIIYGGIYSSDLMDHKGTVIGDIICAKFELSTPSAEYENCLMNAIIDRPKRSADYVSSALTRKQTDHKAVIQWLE
ncbi:MAG TPA: hypothetical protein VFJ43_05020, partial [Bacteroidia bacterium]|nr:hypothetical protein [Bacteroidia bacterium]